MKDSGWRMSANGDDPHEYIPLVCDETCIPIKEGIIRCYLGGPMRGLELYGFPVFDSAAEWLREDGYKIISPAELDRAVGFDPTVSMDLPDGFVADAMRRDVEALLKVDAVVLLPGWETSAGVKIEMAVARALGLPVFTLERKWGAEACTWVPAWSHLMPLPKDREDSMREVAAGGWGAGAEQQIKWLALAPTEVVWSTVEDNSPGYDLDEDENKPRYKVVDCEGGNMLTEVRVTSATGGQKGSKPARFDMIPSDVLWELATHYGVGEAKYPSDPDTGEANWQKGYAWHLSSAALQRHLFTWLAGEDVDVETGSSHLIPVIWHAIALRWFQLHDRGTDDIGGRRLEALYIDQDELDRITATRETV